MIEAWQKPSPWAGRRGSRSFLDSLDGDVRVIFDDGLSEDEGAEEGQKDLDLEICNGQESDARQDREHSLRHKPLIPHKGK